MATKPRGAPLGVTLGETYKKFLGSVQCPKIFFFGSPEKVENYGHFSYI